MHLSSLNNYSFEMSETSQIPLTIITGFLGSGKTTLLNNILTNTSGFKIAVLVNEFGEIGIDSELIVATDDDMIELSNGCICCSIRGDLISAIDTLMERNKSFDYLVIETTGLADPAPVAQTFLADPRMLGLFRLDGVITVVDSHHIIDLLSGSLSSELSELAVKQIAFADRIVFNKISLAPSADSAQITERIKGLNQSAKIYYADYGKVDVSDVLNINAFDLDQVLESQPEFLELEFHDDLAHTQSVGFRVEGNFELERLNIWLRWLLTDPNMTIYRMKGVVCVGTESEKYIFQCVQQLFSSRSEGLWPADIQKCSVVTVIGRNLLPDLIQERFNFARIDG